MNGMIVVLSGPSGAGKGRVFEEIEKRRNNVRKVLSVTTRPKREDDEKKDNYIFVSKNEFIDRIENGEFIEYEWYDEHLYGTLKVPVEELAEHDLFFDKDVRGAMSIKQRYPEAITIYIMPKDKETLLRRRGTRGKNRTEISRDEVPLAKHLDFLVINDDIDETVKQIESIIECMRASSMKSKSSIQFLNSFY